MVNVHVNRKYKNAISEQIILFLNVQISIVTSGGFYPNVTIAEIILET